MAGLGIAAASALLPMLMKSIGLGGGRSLGAGRYIGGRRRRRRQRHRRYRGGGGVKGMRWGYKRCGRCARTHRCNRRRRVARRGAATHIR